MKLADLINTMRSNVASKLEARNKLADELATLRDAETPDEAKIAEVRKAKDDLDAEIDVLREEIKEREAELSRDEAAQRLAAELGQSREERSPARVGREERTYTAEKSARGEASFFSDAYRMQQGDVQARERIERHGQEVVVEREAQERAVGTAGFAGLIVPQFLVEQAAAVARAGRPFANLVQGLQIPEQGTQFQIPKGTTGAATAVQATENSNVQNTDEAWSNVTVNVATVAGQQDVSRQSLERGTPGIDSLIYLDLAGAYGVNVDTQTLSGSGASGQVLGVLNTVGINQASAFTAAATLATFYTKLAGQLNAVQTNRLLAPTAIVMHPRRWYWLISQLDSAGRPLVVPDGQGAFNALAITKEPLDIPGGQAAGTIQGLPVILDANIPTNVGTGPEDQVIVIRAQDALLWEDGDGMPRELRFEQTLGNQLTTKLVVYGYIAFTAGRYPTAVGVVGGNAGTAGFGLAAPAF